MSYGLPIELNSFDSSLIDAFGNLKVSEELSIASYKSIFDKNTQYFDESLSGGATSTFLTNQSMVQLNINAASQTAIRQTYLLHTYQPGKGIIAKITGVLYSTANANFRSELGLLDAKNGSGFYYDGTTVGVMIRSNITGSVVDTKIARTSWNIDTCDDIDFTKTQIYITQAQWLGVGSIWFAIEHNGSLRLVHRQDHNNLITTPYNSTMSLPVSYTCYSVIGFTGSVNMNCICAEVASQGGYNPTGDLRTANRGITTLTVSTTETCLLAIRAKSGFKMNLLIDTLEVIATTADNFLWGIYIGGTVTAGAWVDIGPTNRSEYNMTATGFTGTNKIASGYTSDQLRTVLKTFQYREGSGISINGTPQPIIITGRSITGNTDFLASINFRELY